MFDIVDIGLQGHCLKENGIFGKVGDWLYNFLTDIQQFVMVNNNILGITNNTSSILQGMVLGPILLILLIDLLGDLEI